jgi:hypothetical protein
LPRSLRVLTDEKLLDLRLCELPLRIEHTPIADRVERLYEELETRGINFKPHVWLSSEFFSPDKVPGIAIPFYLAHPRLVELERKQMLEVEGGSDIECMRILRHEAGHALDTAYQIHRRHRWRVLFGSFRTPYPDTYKPRPRSRNYVLHLRAWYAQSHPAEDFAETFAVWLTPNSRWRQRYRGWPALQKLELVDELMREVTQTSPKNRSRIKVEPLSSFKLTLREHYERKREQYSVEWPNLYDKELRRIFSDEARYKKRRTAASFLRDFRPELRELVAEGTGVHQYTINHVLEHMLERCKELRLRLTLSEAETKRKTMIMLTVQIMNVLHSGYHRVAL